MTKRTHKLVIGLVLAACALLASSTNAMADGTRKCDATEAANIREAVAFLKSRRSDLKSPPFSLGKRKGQRRRIRRRIDRKLDDLRFSCAERVLCRENAPRWALHAFGAWGRKIRLCTDKMKAEGASFCDFTGIVAHEFGHAVGIPKDKFGKHHRDRSDRVYAFGNFAESLCHSAGLDRPL